MWTAPDGTPGSGTVLVATGTAAGTTLPIWITGDGIVTRPPTSPARALGVGLVNGVVVLMLDAGLVALAWCATRRATLAVNARSWEREWALVEPQWRNPLRRPHVDSDDSDDRDE
jgi:hypothetical protein